MSKEVNNLPCNNTEYCPLSNGSEVNPIEKRSLSGHDKEISEEGAKYLILTERMANNRKGKLIV